MRQVGKALLWLTLAAFCVCLLGPWHTALERWQVKTVVATINDREITQESLASALREQLWRRGESWASLPAEAADQLREVTLAHLIDACLIPSSSEPLEGKAENELHWFQRQLGFETSRYADALASQQLTEPEFRDRIQQQLQAEAAVESLFGPPIAEGAARAWFEQHHEALSAPRVWRVAHLFLSSHDPAKPDRSEEIQRLSTMLTTGLATFDELVAQYSEDERTKLRRGDLGWFGSARMPDDFVKSIETLRPGIVSAPIKTKLGWHLLKRLDSKPARDLTFDEAREEIICHLHNDQRERALEAVLSELRSTAVINRNEAAIKATIPAP